jgi:hypothetical protein
MQRTAHVPERFSDPASPWDRWSIAESLDIERRHREDFDWLPDLPRSRIGVRTAALPNPLDAWIHGLVAERQRMFPNVVPNGDVDRVRKIWPSKRREAAE